MTNRKAMKGAVLVLFTGILLAGWGTSVAQQQSGDDSGQSGSADKRSQTELSPDRQGTASVGENGSRQGEKSSQEAQEELDGPPYQSDDAAAQPIRPGQMDQEETTTN